MSIHRHLNHRGEEGTGKKMGLSATNTKPQKTIKTMNKTISTPTQEIEKTLRGFTGTTKYYRHSPQLFPLFHLTDGTHYVAEELEAHWLMDFIASHQMNPLIKNHRKLQELQFWTLTVNDSKGVIVCEWDTGQVVYREAISYTDFPLESVSIWVAPLYLGPDDINPPIKRVAYLPSEH